jgi:hypothetical protein
MVMVIDDADPPALMPATAPHGGTVARTATVPLSTGPVVDQGTETVSLAPLNDAGATELHASLRAT